MVVRLLHLLRAISSTPEPAKAASEMVVKLLLLLIVGEVSDVHPLKAPGPMDVTLLPKVTVESAEQSWKASLPTVNESSGLMAADSRVLHREKAPSPSSCSPAGMVIVLRLLHEEKA